jgi:hypothetical protein
MLDLESLSPMSSKADEETAVTRNGSKGSDRLGSKFFFELPRVCLIMSDLDNTLHRAIEDGVQ